MMPSASYVLRCPEQAWLPVAGSDQIFPVRRIHCVGKNYVEHVREMGGDETREPPLFFQKPADSIVHDGATIPYPSMTSDYQYEVELVVALGSGGRNISAEAALDHIFGYGIGIDMTRRDIQREQIRGGMPWETSKSFDYSCPCGPIFPTSRVGHVSTGSIRLQVDGKPRQDSMLENMIWKTPEIISNLSKFYELDAGDIILTGTPSGVGPVVPGNVITCGIQGLGTLTIKIGESES